MERVELKGRWGQLGVFWEREMNAVSAGLFLISSEIYNLGIYQRKCICSHIFIQIQIFISN